MIETIVKGISSGFVMSWTFGTVFFVLIQASIENGYKKGMQIAAGVVGSDAICIVIAVFGTSLIPGIERQEANIGFVGGILLILLGIWMFFKKHVGIKTPQTAFGSLVFFISTGFFLDV